MEDVLEVYTRPYDPDYPVVCFDESSKQLVAEIMEPLPMVVLQKLFKDRAILTINSRYAPTPKS